MPGDPPWHLSFWVLITCSDIMSSHLCHMWQVSYFTMTRLIVSCCTLFVPLSDILKGSFTIIFMVTLLLKQFGFRIQEFLNTQIFGPQLEFNDREKRQEIPSQSHGKTAASWWGRDQIFIIIRNFNRISRKVRSWDLGTITVESILTRTVLKTRLMMVPEEARLQVKKFRDWLKHQNVLPIRTNLWHFVSQC